MAKSGLVTKQVYYGGTWYSGQNMPSEYTVVYTWQVFVHMTGFRFLWSSATGRERATHYWHRHAVRESHVSLLCCASDNPAITAARAIILRRAHAVIFTLFRFLHPPQAGPKGTITAYVRHVR